MQKPKVKKMVMRIDGSRTGASDDVYRVFLQEEALHANDIPGNINIDEEFVRNFGILDGFGVEELIPMNENRSQEPKSDSDYEGDHEDSDFFIDDDNIIEDVEVDMEDFYMNIDTGAETNELSNEAEDIEVINNDEFDSLSDDSRDTRRRKLLKELGKQKVCSEGEIIDQIEMNPEVPVRALQDQLVKKYDVHISGRAISDMLLTNLCEVFNSKLVKGRDKPIISCLEFIREYLMKRVVNVMKVLRKSAGPLTPTGNRLLEANSSLASQKWELTGIPCKHAIATLYKMAKYGEHMGELYIYVHKVYWLDTWKEMYSFKVEPIKDRAMWPKSDCPITLLPPPHHNTPGRPKKKRKITADEKSQRKKEKSQSQSSSYNLSRNFLKITCGKCKKTGHNARTCTGKGGN
ncbi:hypothetical protein LXL04_000715 [Taraxacum kok-saghyz]